MPGILVFSERDEYAFELLSKAREWQGPVAAALLGNSVASRASEYHAYGATRVYLGEDSRLADLPTDICAQALAQVVEASGATTILMAATKKGKELAGRLAQRLGCGAVTDAIGVKPGEGGQLEVQRYALGGNTIATDIVAGERRVIAVMPRTFEAGRQPAAGNLVPVPLALQEPRVRLVERRPKAAATANIDGAETLVVVGKGLNKAEDVALATALARALGGEVGCTRTLASDYHWLGEERMIGISGKKVKPRLMISIGVSGQIQHTVGILGSKVIVAINKDKSAPIFKNADYGIVGDLYQVVPKLTALFGV